MKIQFKKVFNLNSAGYLQVHLGLKISFLIGYGFHDHPIFYLKGTFRVTLYFSNLVCSVTPSRIPLILDQKSQLIQRDLKTKRCHQEKKIVLFSTLMNG